MVLFQLKETSGFKLSSYIYIVTVVIQTADTKLIVKTEQHRNRLNRSFHGSANCH